MSNMSPEELQLDLVLSSFAGEVKHSYTTDPHTDSSLIYKKSLLQALHKTGSALVKRTTPRFPDFSSVKVENDSHDAAYYQQHPDKPIDEMPGYLAIEASGESLQELLERGNRTLEEVTQLIHRLGPG